MGKKKSSKPNTDDPDPTSADSRWLGTATKVAGLLAGIVALTYLLGGLVIALRLLFDGFSASAVVTLLGQLPRELVISTALLEVAGPAATVGLAAAIFYGALNGPRRRRGNNDRLDRGRCPALTFLVLAAVSIVLTLPAFFQAAGTDGLSVLLFVGVGAGLIVTFCLAAAGWYLIRRTARKRWPRMIRAVAAGALWAAMALIPAVMLAGALEFERAQVCVSGSPLPVEGDLVGETSDHVLLATDFEDEESILSLPADQVTKSEYGDLTSNFICSVADAADAGQGEADVDLGGHGGDLEVALATGFRPRLLFDRDERWRPLEVSRFLAERFDDGSGHRACASGSGSPCPSATGVTDLRGAAIAYLDLHGEGRDGADFGSPPSDCERAPPAVDCDSGPESVVYYRRTSHEGRWYWDYWWFLRYNDYTGSINRCRLVCGDHEGDWEGVTVITTASLRPMVLGAIYATHKDRVLVDTAVLPVTGDHVDVYVADGTHAAYPFACPHGCKQYAKLTLNLPEDGHDGFASWTHNDDESCAAALCVRPLPEAAGNEADDSLPRAAAWAAWRGLWGSTCHAGCRGRKSLYEASPRSPGLQVRFRCPWAPTREATPGSGGSGLTRSTKVGDTKRLLAACKAQRGGL